MGFCLCMRKLCPVPFSAWQKRASGRLFETSRIVCVWQMTELVSTAMDFVSHRGQMNLVSVCNLCCVFGVIIVTSDSAVKSGVLLETICGRRCDWYDPRYGNSVGDAMTLVSSSSLCCCLCECKE